MTEFEGMQARERRERRSPAEIRRSLNDQREAHDAKCHARTSYKSAYAVGVLLTPIITDVGVVCLLPGGHDGPHETMVEGRCWQFPDA